MKSIALVVSAIRTGNFDDPIVVTMQPWLGMRRRSELGNIVQGTALPVKFSFMSQIAWSRFNLHMVAENPSFAQT